MFSFAVESLRAFVRRRPCDLDRNELFRVVSAMSGQEYRGTRDTPSIDEEGWVR